MTGRQRAAAVIVRDGRVLMVHERGLGPTGRHDGDEYWTLPGGGIRPGESPGDAVRREVYEEVGLSALAVRFLQEVPYPSGVTSCFTVDADDTEEPALGRDTDLGCGCPRMVGLVWMPLPAVSAASGRTPIAPLVVAW